MQDSAGQRLTHSQLVVQGCEQNSKFNIYLPPEEDRIFCISKEFESQLSSQFLAAF